MSEQKISTKEKIILAAIDCIEKEGIQEITIRRIARQAGVNSAAINYYFGTKEKLVDLALNRTLDEMTKMPAENLDRDELEPRERLQAFLETFMGGAIQWPGIAKAHLYAPLMQDNYKTLFVKRFNALLDDVMTKIKGLKLRYKGQDLKLIVPQMMSAVTVPGLMPGLFSGFSQLNFEDRETRKIYVSDLIDHYFE